MAQSKQKIQEIHSAADGANPHKTALGYAEASFLGVTSFGGLPVDSSSVLIRYTLSGDANIDGVGMRAAGHIPRSKVTTCPGS